MLNHQVDSVQDEVALNVSWLPLGWCQVQVTLQEKGTHLRVESFRNHGVSGNYLGYDQ